MKSIIIILILSSISFGCKSQVDNHLDKNDLDKQNLFGPIRSVKEYSFQSGEPIKVDNDHCVLYRLYNTSGNLTEHFQYDHNKVTAKSIFIYDHRNLRTESTSRSYFFDEQCNKTVYEYNSIGNVTTEKYYYCDKALDLSSTTKYVYNEKNKQSEKIEFDYKGNKTNHTYFRYDSAGNEIEAKWYYENDLGNNTIKKYDDLGNIIQSDTEFPNVNKTSRSTFRYDYNNNLVEKKWDNNGEIIIEQFDYEYDDNRNWIKQTKTYNGEKKPTIVRVFEYY